MLCSQWFRFSCKKLLFGIASPALSCHYTHSCFIASAKLMAYISNRELHHSATHRASILQTPHQLSRPYSTLTPLEFERICEETLESLTERFEELGDLDSAPSDFDVNYAAGVLTIQLGSVYGTYVINKQTPNMQIWLSSPKSGPKRYDFNGKIWYYKHDNSVLHELLEIELINAFGRESKFSQCSYGGK